MVAAGTRLRPAAVAEGLRFTPRGLVITALLWVWSEETALTHAFSLALGIARRVARRSVPRRNSYQAFLKLLVRWGDVLLTVLKQGLRRRLETALKSHLRVTGFLVYGVDGSRIDLPRTAANAAAFAPAAASSGGSRRSARRASTQSRSARRKKGNGPQLWLTTLWHVGTGLAWDWRLGPADSSERHHFRDMLGELPDEALITADAGYVGYDTWQAVLASGREFVIRVGGNVRLLKQLGFVRESQGTVYLWPDREAQRAQPPLVLRLVVVHDGRQPWFLVTSVRHPRRLSAAQVAEIYRRRWGVELYFRHFKQTFGRRKLRSRTPQHVTCEAHWALAAFHALQLHAAVVLQRHGHPPHRLSVATALRAVRHTLRQSDCPRIDGPSLTQRLSRALIDDYVRDSKASRDYPRQRYETPPRSPQLHTATQKQRQLAQTITRQRQGLTA